MMVCLKVNLPNSGTWIITTDQYVVHENFSASVPQGWLARDHHAWCRSHSMIRSLQKRTNAKMIFGHCRDVSVPIDLERCSHMYRADALPQTLMKYKLAPEYYD